MYPHYEPGTNTLVLKRILRTSPSPCPPDYFTQEEIEEREKFDRALSFLDDLYYCLQRQVLTPSEVSHYGYFLYHIYHCEPVKEYCKLNGFHTVLELCQIVRAEEMREAGLDQALRPTAVAVTDSPGVQSCQAASAAELYP